MKKAQAPELFNVILGCILLFVAIIIFIGITFSIRTATRQEVSDINSVDTASIYLQVLPLINKTQFTELLIVASRINEEHETIFFSSDISVYLTAEGQIQPRTLDIVNRRLQSMIVKRRAYFYRDQDLISFHPLYALNIPLDIRCGRLVTRETQLFCEAKSAMEVLHE